jgi:anti-anti-sigma regulatory factor
MSLLGVDHLDGEALQILLALRADCRKHGKQLLLTQVSPGLSRWFMYAGAEHHLSWS